MSQQNILIFESELRALAAEANRYPDRETGGDLYGLWTYAQRPVVFLATGPGPRAKGTSGEFQQDTDFMEKSMAFLQENFGLQYLGDWHSHHWLGLRQPSEGDRRRVFNFTSKRQWTRMAEIIVTHGGRNEWDTSGRQSTLRSPRPYAEAGESDDLRDPRFLRGTSGSDIFHQARGLSEFDRIEAARASDDYQYTSRVQPAFECVHPYLYLERGPQEMRPPVPATLRCLPGESPMRSTLAASPPDAWLDRFQARWNDFPVEMIRVSKGPAMAFRQREREPRSKEGFLSRLTGGGSRRPLGPEYTRPLLGELSDLPYQWEKEDKRGGWLSVPIENFGTLAFHIRLTQDNRPQIRGVELHDSEGRSRDVSHDLDLDAHNQRSDSVQCAIMQLVTHDSGSAYT